MAFRVREADLESQRTTVVRHGLGRPAGREEQRGPTGDANDVMIVAQEQRHMLPRTACTPSLIRVLRRVERPVARPLWHDGGRSCRQLNVSSLAPAFAICWRPF